MAKKDYFLIADTETTITDKVADFGAVVCDRKGRVVKSCGVLVDGIFGVDALFYIADDAPGSLWSKQGKDRRFTHYQNMVKEGTRMIASVGAINKWLERVRGEYDPILTAYNLAFDLGKCENTSIDLTPFDRRFCLWHAAANRWAHTKKYLQFVLEAHGFNNPTGLGNMSYKTNAEIMARFVLGLPDLEDEPHTALEDVMDYELPILKRLLHSTPKQELLNPKEGYNWRNYQVRDYFQPK